MSSPEKRKRLTLFSFLMITGSMVITVKTYPAFATSGLSLIFFLLFTGICFFIPVAFVAAELATGENWQSGGVYKWVSEAFGQRWGFVAVFFQWFQISIGFVTMLYFIIGCLSYILDLPEMNNNPFYKSITAIILFWTITLISLRGTNFIAKLAGSGLILGVIIPAFFLIFLAIIYVLNGNNILISLDISNIIPSFNHVNNLVILVSFLLSYSGVEASASYINDFDNPNKNYPIVVIIIVFFTIMLNIMGSLAIASVIPINDIVMNQGVVQTFQYLLDYYNLGYLVKILALFIALGAISEICSWSTGPIQSLLVAAKDGILNQKYTKVNDKNVPINLVLIQGFIVSSWIIVLTFCGGGSNLSFLLAISLTVLTYLLMYILLFLAYFKLKYSHSHVKRTFLVPGGVLGRNIIPFIGLATSIFALGISFFPPIQVIEENTGIYEKILMISFFFINLLPHLVYSFRGR